MTGLTDQGVSVVRCRTSITIDITDFGFDANTANSPLQKAEAARNLQITQTPWLIRSA
jgi:hypothetical protein